MNLATPWTMLLVRNLSASSSLTRTIVTALSRSKSVSIHGPIGLKVSLFLARRSEEHTSELQSQSNLVCRLLLEKKSHLSHHQPQPSQLLPSSARNRSCLRQFYHRSRLFPQRPSRSLDPLQLSENSYSSLPSHLE